MAYKFRVRGKGHFTTGTTRSGKAFVHDGRRVTVKGDSFQLTWNGPSIVSIIEAALVEAFTQLSDSALAYMQSIVPVDTGFLRDSCYVNVTTDGDRLVLQIGAEAFYAIYIELGTFRMAARPYIRPTFDYATKLLPGILKAEVARRGNAA